MVNIPTPVLRLCLSYEFDVKTTKRLSKEIHDDAIKKAALELDRTIGFGKHGVTANDFSATVIDGASIDSGRQLTMLTAHNAPFDPNFHVATGGPAIRYDFIYSDNCNSDGSVLSSKLFLRVVTSFGKPTETIDGVTASRVGLTALEILEGNDIHPTVFPKYPVVKYGIRHVMNFIYYIILRGVLAIPLGYMLAYVYIVMEFLGLKKQVDVTSVNNITSMVRFYSSKNANEKTMYQLYRSEDKRAFKSFIGIAENWTKSLGINIYMYLLNASPLITGSFTKNIYDITNLEARYRGVILPPRPPPGDKVWRVMNYIMANKILVNNYGVHRHNFSAKPKSFIWDRLHLCNSAHVAACISINGVFMCCFRGLPTTFQSLSVPDDIVPDNPQIVTANIEWRKTMK